MIESIKQFLGISETQQKTIALLEVALKNKNYKIFTNDLDYGSHSLCVHIILSYDLGVVVNNLFATTDFMAFNPQEQKPQGVWTPAISSRKAYYMVLNHFKQILLDEAKAQENAYNNKQSRFADIAKKSI